MTLVLLSRIKNNSLHILVEICQTIHLMYMLAKNIFYDSTKVFFVWSSFLIISRLLSVLLFVFMLIVLEMHLGFAIIVFFKKLLSIVEEIYYGEFFMHVLDNGILQQSKSIMTPLQFVIGPLISKILKCASFYINPKYALLTFASNNQGQWSCMGGIMLRGIKYQGI